VRLGVSAFFCGVWAMLLLRDLPDTAIFIILLLLSLPVGFRYPKARALVWFVLGLWWATYRAHGMLAGALEVTLENEPIKIQGVIVGLPQAREKSTRFLFEIESVHGLRKDWPSPGRVRLGWYIDPPELIPGQRWELMVKLKRPRGFRNPGGFDYERWLFQQRLRATGYVLQSSRNRLLGNPGGQIIERMRFQLAQGLDQYLGPHPEAGLIKALALGATDGITQSQWQVLALTGTTHLVAISGLHVSLAAGLIFFLARRLWSLTGYGVLYLPAPRFAALAAMAGATVYALLAGFSVPTQRALAMLAVVLLGGSLWRWRLGWRDTLLAALFAVLILDPFSTMFPGFWLSFGGVAVIALALAHRHGENVFWWQLSKTQFLVALGLAPMLVVFFGQNPMLSPLANLVAVPWVSFLIVPLLLVAVVLWVPFPAAAHVLVDLATHALSWLLPFLDGLASLQFATWKHPAAGWWPSSLAFVGVFLLLLPRGLPGRWLGVIFLLPLISAEPNRPEPGQFWFTLLDVGQGLAGVVETNQHTLLFDTGPRLSPDLDAGSMVIVPFLKQRGVSTLDTVVLSHGDSDHTGGFDGVSGSLSLKTVIAAAGVQHIAGDKRCQDGESWNWDGVQFRFLHPPADYSGTDNDGSCVLHVSNGATALLLSGDIEQQAETRLYAHYAKTVAASVLLVPHHGSNTSSTKEFLAAVDPVYALIAVGHNNRYKFPHDDVLKRYHERKIHLVSTADSGAISLHFGRGVSVPEGYRQTARRFWHAQPN